MTDNALIVPNGSGAALAQYQGREEVRELGDRLMKMHPAAGEVGPDAMRAAAQLALLLGANPLPGVNEIHIWKDNKGRNCMSLGINFWRRKAAEWGGVLYEVRPRLMRSTEAAEYSVPSGTTAAICKGVRANDMIRYRQLGFNANEVWDMCGRTGVGTTTPNEYAKQGRPPSWTALKRAETDMLRQLFPAEFGNADRQMLDIDGPVSIAPAADVIEGELTGGGDATRYTLASLDQDFFGEDATTSNPMTVVATQDGEYEAVPTVAPTPANGNGGDGPLTDDEVMVSEADNFINAAAVGLGTDAGDIKRRMGAAGLTFPKTPAARLAAYQQLRGDRPVAGKQQGEPAQDGLFANDDTTARQAALATATGQLD